MSKPIIVAEGDTLLTPAEVADILRVSPRTLLNWDLPHLKFGANQHRRYLRSGIEKLLIDAQS